MGALVDTFPVRLARKLMPVEWALIIFAILAGILYQRFDLPLPGQPGSESSLGPGLFYLKQLLTSLDLYAIVWILQIMVYTVLALKQSAWKLRSVDWPGIGTKFSHRLDLREIFQDLRLFHAILVMFVLFALLKHLIPHVNPIIYDDEFAVSEKFFCGGVYCAHYLRKLLGDSAVEFVSSTYRWYFPYMSIVLFVFIAQNNRKLAHEYCCAFSLMFLIGILWVFALPTWGPVYWEPSAFDYVKSSSIGELQSELWKMKLHLDSNPNSREAVFLISGFPSLHIAVITLGSWYLMRINRLLGFASILFLLLIVNSTLYLGWHYVADDIGAVFLAWMCVRLTRYLSWEWRKDLPADAKRI